MAIHFSMAVGAKSISSFSNSFCKSFKYFFRVLPANARICDTDSVFQTFFALFGDLLGAFTGSVFTSASTGT